DIQPRVNSFSLNFSIDGLPLHKSSRKQFWSILMTVQEMPETPVLMVGNFYGEDKPNSAEEYLWPLVELKDVIQNGVAIANKLIEVRVRTFIADSPARALIKGVAYYNHILGCQKCTVHGVSDVRSGVHPRLRSRQSRLRFRSRFSHHYMEYTTTQHMLYIFLG
uniref:Uncharacterized protein n=1 Tax=Anopheles funestus TaxID=62324 RepID=A0A182S0F9_ANOFN